MIFPFLKFALSSSPRNTKPLPAAEEEVEGEAVLYAAGEAMFRESWGAFKDMPVTRVLGQR